MIIDSDDWSWAPTIDVFAVEEVIEAEEVGLLFRGVDDLLDLFIFCLRVLMDRDDFSKGDCDSILLQDEVFFISTSIRRFAYSSWTIWVAKKLSLFFTLIVRFIESSGKGEFMHEKSSSIGFLRNLSSFEAKFDSLNKWII